MSTTNGGPITWIQPRFNGGGDELYINGLPTGVELSSFSMSSADGAGVVVDTASGHQVPHAVIGDVGAPISNGRMEFELEWQHVAEIPFRHAHRIVGQAAVGLLAVVLDTPIFDSWLGDGVRTTHVLNHSTSYGTTGIPFVNRPAVCTVYTSGSETELAAVTGAPGPGEFQISQTSDATTFVTGDPPVAGVELQLGYYPLLRCTEASLSEDMEGRNDWTITVEFRSYNIARSFV